MQPDKEGFLYPVIEMWINVKSVVCVKKHVLS